MEKKMNQSHRQGMFLVDYRENNRVCKIIRTHEMHVSEFLTSAIYHLDSQNLS